LKFNAELELKVEILAHHSALSKKPVSILVRGHEVR
jgi:hypothetical protein